MEPTTTAPGVVVGNSISSLSQMNDRDEEDEEDDHSLRQSPRELGGGMLYPQPPQLSNAPTLTNVPRKVLLRRPPAHETSRSGETEVSSAQQRQCSSDRTDVKSACGSPGDASFLNKAATSKGSQQSVDKLTPLLTLEQREQAYEEARRRIFGTSSSTEFPLPSSSIKDTASVTPASVICQPRPLRPRPYRAPPPSALHCSVANGYPTAAAVHLPALQGYSYYCPPAWTPSGSGYPPPPPPLPPTSPLHHSLVPGSQGPLTNNVLYYSMPGGSSDSGISPVPLPVTVYGNLGSHRPPVAVAGVNSGPMPQHVDARVSALHCDASSGPSSSPPLYYIDQRQPLTIPISRGRESHLCPTPYDFLTSDEHSYQGIQGVPFSHVPSAPPADVGFNGACSGSLAAPPVPPPPPPFPSDVLRSRLPVYPTLFRSSVGTVAAQASPPVDTTRLCSGDPVTDGARLRASPFTVQNASHEQYGGTMSQSGSKIVDEPVSGQRASVYDTEFPPLT